MEECGHPESGELAYETPELEIHKLSSVVMSGPTGGGDSAQTRFPDEGPGGTGNEGENSEEEDLYGDRWPNNP